MSKTCEQKSKQLHKELQAKSGKSKLSHSIYICHSCAAQRDFHPNIVQLIKDKYGDKPCILCEEE